MLENLMLHTVNVNRPTFTQDASGGEVDSYTTVYAAQPCSIQPVSTSWLVRYQMKQVDVTHTLYFSGPLTVLVGDQIVYGTRTFLVRGKRDLVELSLVTVVDCQEINLH